MGADELEVAGQGGMARLEKWCLKVLVVAIVPGPQVLQ